MTDLASARYVYAVTRGLSPVALDGASGLRSAPLQVVSAGGLDAVASDVPLAEFSEEALTRNLESLSWLEEVARAHDDVVRLVTGHGPTAPLRLATIFHDDTAIRGRLEEWRDRIEPVLDRIDGRAEWSVKVLVADQPAAAAAQPAARSGTEFLMQRKAVAEDRGRRAVDADRVAEEVHRALTQVSVASRALPAQDPTLTGHSDLMALNGAYLVEVGREAEFEHVVRELAERFSPASVASAGPWPPYSFAIVDQG